VTQVKWMLRHLIDPFVYVFVFQAEDGIRDFHVTGVQTCALPISRTGPPSCSPATMSSHSSAPSEARAGADASCRAGVAAGAAGRSEERRVGKEGRSRSAACRWYTPSRGYTGTRSTEIGCNA